LACRSTGNLEDVKEDSEQEHHLSEPGEVDNEDDGESMMAETSNKSSKNVYTGIPQQNKKQKTDTGSAADEAIVQYIKKKAEIKKPVQKNDDNVTDFMNAMTTNITKFPLHIKS
jgi:hypothetical protein